MCIKIRRTALSSFCILALAVCVFSAGTQTSRAARVKATSARDLPVLFVHGLMPIGARGYSCKLYWSEAKRTLERLGWQKGPLVDVSFYAGDTGCSEAIDDFGDHNVHYGNNIQRTLGFNHAQVNPNSHDEDTDLEHVAYHLARYIESEPAFVNGVVIYAHSMGALITAYMLSQVEGDHPDFPSLRVPRVFSVDGEFRGVRLAASCAFSRQCIEMMPNSHFIKGLSKNPQAQGGTAWTVVGSYGSQLVPEQSAVGLDGATAKIIYKSPAYGHFAYMHDSSSKADAAYDYLTGGEWHTTSTGLHSLPLADAALSGCLSAKSQAIQCRGKTGRAKRLR